MTCKCGCEIYDCIACKISCNVEKSVEIKNKGSIVNNSDLIYDVRGKAIKIGSNVVYPVRFSSTCVLKYGKVKSFTYEDATNTVSSVKVENKDGKIATIKRLDRLAVTVR